MAFMRTTAEILNYNNNSRKVNNMGTSLPRKWYKVDEPEAGEFTLVNLAGYVPEGGTNKDTKTLYICTSDEGHLNVAFEWGDPNWEIVYDN